MPDATRPQMGIVVIGRNEGERLKMCLSSVRGHGPVVYVDSGSTDDSVALARGLGAEVVALDLIVPFTAARARNVGFKRLMEVAPNHTYVQFVDGDCVVVDGWLVAAADYLEAHPQVAVVCGRRRERYPERSVYNRLCDQEWDTPVGEAKACGGDALMRVAAFQVVRGFRDDLIAGEEPELCVRLRAEGWKVWRLNEEMTLHDAAMTRLGQWWKRSVRAGYAFAEGAHLHGAPPERHWLRESRSAWFWGAGIPLLVLVGVLVFGIPGFWLLAIYPLQVLRLALRGERSPRENLWRALFLVLGKLPEVQGQIRFLWNRRLGRRSRLIEYK